MLQKKKMIHFSSFFFLVSSVFETKYFDHFFLRLNSTSFLFYYMFTETFTRGIDSTDEQFLPQTLGTLVEILYVALKSENHLATRWKQKRNNPPFNTHLCAVCLRVLKISDGLVKNCILPFSFLLGTHTSIILSNLQIQSSKTISMRNSNKFLK